MYKALKPFRSAGVDYIIDDEVDVSKLNVAQVANLVQKKLIVKMGESETTAPVSPVPELITIPINTEDGTMDVSVTLEQLLVVIALLQLTAEGAAKEINELTEEPQLILIHRLDSRKTVQKAAKERAEALAKAAEEAQKADETNNAETNNAETNNEENGDV